MKPPFTSRKKADEAMCLLVEVTRRCMADADQRFHEERAARRKAEVDLESAREFQHRASVNAWQAVEDDYELGVRLKRALRAVAQLRAEAATQRRFIRQLTDQLLDATGYQGEPLLPAARTMLDIAKEDSQ